MSLLAQIPRQTTISTRQFPANIQYLVPPVPYLCISMYICVNQFLFTAYPTSSEVVLLSQKSTSSEVGSGRSSVGMYRDSTVRSSWSVGVNKTHNAK